MKKKENKKANKKKLNDKCTDKVAGGSILDDFKIDQPYIIKAVHPQNN